MATFDPFSEQRRTGSEPQQLETPARPAQPQFDLDSLSRFLSAQSAARVAQRSPSSMFQSGPVLFETRHDAGGTPFTQARSITGGFAPGTAGATLQEWLPRLLAALTQGGSAIGLPSREDLLNPRLADLGRTFGQERSNLLNRFASLGRDVTGSVPTEELGQLGSREAMERSRATGEVDLGLAQLNMGAQNAMLSRVLAIMQALGLGGR